MLLRLAFLPLTVALALCAALRPSTASAPFIETFQRNGRTLIYVVARHHSPVLFPDPMSDPVFRTIQSVFSRSPPDAVVHEGVDPSQIQGFLEYAKECASANFDMSGKPCDEPAFTAWSATRNGVPVYTGEPSARAELSFFETRGYSIQDFLAFWIMANIPPEKRHGQLTLETFGQLVDRVVGNKNHLLGTAVRFNIEDFAAWYAKNMPTPRNYLDIANEDTSPTRRPGSLRRYCTLSLHLLTRCATKMS